MEVSVLSSSNSVLSSKELLSHLSEIVLGISNDEVGKRKESLDEKISSLVRKKKEMREVKAEVIRSAAEWKRLKSLKRCLELINTLKREGVLRGADRSGLSRILSNIEKKDVQSLNRLEERLTIYLPEKTNRVSII